MTPKTDTERKQKSRTAQLESGIKEGAIRRPLPIAQYNLLKTDKLLRARLNAAIDQAVFEFFKNELKLKEGE